MSTTTPSVLRPLLDAVWAAHLRSPDHELTEEQVDAIVKDFFRTIPRDAVVGEGEHALRLDTEPEFFVGYAMQCVTAVVEYFRAARHHIAKQVYGDWVSFTYLSERREQARMMIPAKCSPRRTTFTARRGSRRTARRRARSPGRPGSSDDPEPASGRQLVPLRGLAA